MSMDGRVNVQRHSSTSPSSPPSVPSITIAGHNNSSASTPLASDNVSSTTNYSVALALSTSSSSTYKPSSSSQQSSSSSSRAHRSSMKAYSDYLAQTLRDSSKSPKSVGQSNHDQKEFDTLKYDRAVQLEDLSEIYQRVGGGRGSNSGHDLNHTLLSLHDSSSSLSSSAAVAANNNLSSLNGVLNNFFVDHTSAAPSNKQSRNGPGNSSSNASNIYQQLHQQQLKLSTNENPNSMYPVPQSRTSSSSSLLLLQQQQQQANQSTSGQQSGHSIYGALGQLSGGPYLYSQMSAAAAAALAGVSGDRSLTAAQQQQIMSSTNSSSMPLPDYDTGYGSIGALHGQAKSGNGSGSSGAFSLANKHLLNNNNHSSSSSNSLYDLALLGPGHGQSQRSLVMDRRMDVNGGGSGPLVQQNSGQLYRSNTVTGAGLNGSANGNNMRSSISLYGYTPDSRNDYETLTKRFV